MSGSGKLDQSLDDILKAGRQANRRSNRQKPATGSKANARPAAPVGGVKKVTKPVRTVKPPTASSADGESKVLVSSLPSDVTEKQIQEYFHQMIGSVKRVLLSYGPNGKSRGVATVIFNKLDGAAKAAESMDGVKVDGRPMKVEVILGAKDAPAPAPAKTLKDRITGPKSTAKAQPKPATVTKANGPKQGKKGRVVRKGRSVGRGKPKTVEELDAEMKDYFEQDGKPAGESDTAMGNGGAVQPPAGGDTGMDDEIM